MAARKSVRFGARATENRTRAKESQLQGVLRTRGQMHLYLISASDAIRADLMAARTRDPAARGYALPFLYYKGFHALQAYRLAHWLWEQGRHTLAAHFQNRISEVFGVDIHPAARIGSGILIDHGTGVVIGETAVVEDNVSLLHEVTLGGTGKETGDRHPKVRRRRAHRRGCQDLGQYRDWDRGKSRRR